MHKCENIEVRAKGVVLVRKKGPVLLVRVYQQLRDVADDSALTIEERKLLRARFLSRHLKEIAANCDECGDGVEDDGGHVAMAMAATGTPEVPEATGTAGDGCASAAIVISIGSGGTATVSCDPPTCANGTCEPRVQVVAEGSMTPECYCKPRYVAKLTDTPRRIPERV